MALTVDCTVTWMKLFPVNQQQRRRKKDMFGADGVSIYGSFPCCIHRGTKQTPILNDSLRAKTKLSILYRVSTNAVAANPTAWQCWLIKVPVSVSLAPSPPLPAPPNIITNCNSKICLSVIVPYSPKLVSFRRHSTTHCVTSLAQASTYLGWMRRQQWMKYRGSKSQISLLCNILALEDNV